MIKRICERFQIDIRPIHVLVKFRTRIVRYITGCHRDRFDPPLATRLRYIDRVLGKDHRIIVSERYRSTAEPLRGECDLLRRRSIGELVPFARLGDIPVLTKPATEITSGCAEREHAASWQKVIQRFLLNRIDAKPTAPAISREHHTVPYPLPNETKAALSFM